MAKKITFNEYFNQFSIEEVEKALKDFVKAGVLKMCIKNGEPAYIENPEFRKKSKKEQDIIFKNLLTH